MVTRKLRGFTMIEIIIVFAMIGVTGVILSLTAAGVLQANKERAAEENANRVVLAQGSFARKHGSYTGFPKDLGSIDGLAVVHGPSDTLTQVSIALGEAGTLGVAVRKNDDTCIMYQLTDLAAGGSSKRVTPAITTICDAQEALPVGEPLDVAAATTSRAGG